MPGFKRLRLGEMLVAAGLITDEQVQQALVVGKKEGRRLGQQLVRQGLVKESALVDVIARQMSLDKYSSAKYPVDSTLASLIPAELAVKNKLAPLVRQGSLLKVAMSDPLDINAIEDIEIYKNCEVEPIICTEAEMAQLTNVIYGMAAGLEGVLESIESMSLENDSAEAVNDDTRLSSLADMAEEAPVVRLVNSILTQAVRERASDIHISPEKNTVQVRFRVDGKLKLIPAPPKQMILPVISRIKILARLDIAVSRIPQDGRFSVVMDNKEINVRVSTMPTIYGENVVLRLLDMSAGGLLLTDLGLTDADMEKIRRAIQKPHGMFLSTGPTGSGKSTSLFSIMREINRPDINIITLEDPVEYRMDGIRQVQLNRKAGMTFAGGLRSILRQDPDVIMVGEIRDGETAGIAVQAALTGHMVFSTVHTNDAAGAVARFMDMGVEPFLVASVLVVSIAQRLVRRICPHCRQPYAPSKDMLKFWGLDSVSGTEFYKGNGCFLCGETGYKGRVGIYEILVIDEDIQEMIVQRKTAQEISRFAADRGVLTLLKDDARLKVLQGETTFEEAASAVMV